MTTQIQKSVEETIAELSAKNILEYLKPQQQAALQSKFLALDEDIRKAAVEQYPGLPFAFVYLLRGAVKEANRKIVSDQKPKWQAILSLHAMGVSSSDANAKKASVKALAEFGESIDPKERVTLLKRYKNEKDMSSTHNHIIELCGIFGISPEALAAKG